MYNNHIKKDIDTGKLMKLTVFDKKLIWSILDKTKVFI